VPPRPSKSLKQAAAPASGDLLSLSSSAPKLQHLCSERPRRLKNLPVSRPTVCPSHAQDNDDADDNVEAFFAPGKMTTSVSSDVVNGELEKG